MFRLKVIELGCRITPGWIDVKIGVCQTKVGFIGIFVSKAHLQAKVLGFIGLGLPPDFCVYIVTIKTGIGAII